MDAKKFGVFLTALRKEQNMTQAELASKLKVTDKAVSRWERGIGLPDISMLEPLSEALHITVLELLRSERLNQQELSPEDASETVVETIKMASEQRKLLKKRLLAIFIGIVCIAAFSGFAFGLYTLAIAIIVFTGYIIYQHIGKPLRAKEQESDNMENK